MEHGALILVLAISVSAETYSEEVNPIGAIDAPPVKTRFDDSGLIFDVDDQKNVDAQDGDCSHCYPFTLAKNNVCRPWSGNSYCVDDEEKYYCQNQKNNKGGECIPSGLHCYFVSGDGTGGTEQKVGDTNSRDECVALVHKNRPDANGVTYGDINGNLVKWYTGKSACYAEIGSKGTDGAKTFQTCIFQRKIRDCEFKDGDGNGRTEKKAGYTNSRDKCVALVHITHPSANGVTYGGDKGGTACYAEFKATSINGASGWKSCIFKDA